LRARAAIIIIHFIKYNLDVFILQVNIPVFNFSPINNTRVRYDDHDEYINKLIFLQGIGIYYKIIWAIGNAFQYYYA